MRGLNAAARYERTPSVLWRTYGDETLLSAVGSVEVQVLAGPAVDVWELLAEARDPEEIVELLTRRYEAPAEIVRREVVDLLVRLRGHGFVREVAPSGE